MCSVPNLGGLSYWHSSELYTSYYKNCDSISMFNPDKEAKHFLTPIGSLHLTHQECNEILLKRAAANNGEHNNSGEQQMNSGSDKLLVNDAPAKTRPYSCNECGKSFLLKHHLTTHSRVHTGERPHVCIHCGKAFAHKHCLNTHLLLHSSERPYRCEECKKNFTLKHHLHTHLRVHNRERPFVCDKCGRAFPLKRHLVTHGKYHAGERPFVCHECGESFAQKDHLVMHSRFHGSLNTFACQDCGATFTRKFELVNHGKLHGRIPHRCPICDKEFLQKRTLVTHMRCHTANLTPTSFPKIVNQLHQSSLGSPPDLKSHFLHPNQSQHQQHDPQHPNQMNHSPQSQGGQELQMKHSPQSPIPTCHECGTSFNSHEALALHVRLHTGDSALVTDLCVLTASLQNPNFTHSLSHHPHHAAHKPPPPQPKIKPHICPHCQKPFAARHGLLQHNKRHPDGCCNIRSHICNICSKSFFQKNHLLLHQRQHMIAPEFAANRNNGSGTSAVPHNNMVGGNIGSGLGGPSASPTNSGHDANTLNSISSNAG